MLLIAAKSAVAAEIPQFKGTLRTETADRPPMEIPFWVSANQLRMDINQPMEMTVVWSFGAEPSMRMIRHEERIFVEWGPTQLENARQMVKRTTAITEPDAMQFEATGARTLIEGWDTFEMRRLPEESGGRLWLTSDSSYGLAEFFAHYARALDETTRFPMTGTDNDPLGLNHGTGLPLDQLSNAIGLDGRVVRIVDDGDGKTPSMQTTITLHSLVPGPFAEDLFAVPDGYHKAFQLSSGVP
jgi:hypothetical protein